MRIQSFRLNNRRGVRSLHTRKYTGYNLPPAKDLRNSPVEVATAQEAVAQFVKSGDSIYVQMGCATPTQLLQGLADNNDLKNIKMYNMSMEGPAPHLAPNCIDRIRSYNLFIGANSRESVNKGQSDFVPVFFSEVPLLIRSKKIPLDVAFVQVSPPDIHGWCSLGVSVENAVAAVETASRVIALVNPQMPRTHGDGVIHVNHMAAVVEVDEPIHNLHYKAGNENDDKIGEYVASLIPDGATIQMGIGSIPNAVLSKLHNHKDLGIHTEMFSDGVIPLIEKGVVNNSRKTEFIHKTVATFLMGSKKLYDFVHDNPSVAMLDVAYVNSPLNILRQPAVHAINSAIEVDLTGQVCADSIGTRMFSGIGGQMDFMRGAALSPGGKPILALPSITNKGESRIVPTLKEGAGVVTTRAHVHYVVTEYGIATLQGKSIRERAYALAKIAHPSHRDALYASIRKRFGPCSSFPSH